MGNLCPCGSNRSLSDCCEPIITGRKNAETALEIMRSRYTAFTMANGEYLMRSHSAKTRPVKEQKSIEKWAKSVTWLGLIILGTKAGNAGDRVGYVEFKAAYLENGKLGEIHEKSFFTMENQRWVYVSGVHF